jgi:hypothetical protein
MTHIWTLAFGQYGVVRWLWALFGEKMQWKRAVMTDFVVYIATASLMLSKVVNYMCCEIIVFEMPCLGWCNTVHQKYCLRLWRLKEKLK